MSRQAIVIGADRVVRPWTAGGATPHGSRRIVMLVHGFNNDQGEAGRSFSDMRRNVDRILSDGGYDDARRRAVQDSMWEVHWPGYVQLGSPWRDRRNLPEHGLTAALYNVQVVKARSWVADALADYCASLGPITIFFVAHSLGCRVVLETIDRLAGRLNRRVALEGVLLMAGAVAVHELRPSRLGAATASLTHRFCFYSPKDMVLLFAFSPGQAAAGEIPVYLVPIATGLTGMPRGLWNSARNTGFGHGGYWKGALASPASAEATSAMRAMFLTTLVGTAPAESQAASTALPTQMPRERHPASRTPSGANWLNEFCV